MALALEPDVLIVGEADCAKTAIELAQALQPDVVLTELSCCSLANGLSAAGLVRAAPNCAVIVLSLFDDAPTRAAAIASGAAAFVGKHESHETLLASIRREAR
jgi:DNA-binding NarL/FixJ family response regulator